MSLLRTSSLPGPLGTVLQPIVDFHGQSAELFAVECLTRGPRGTRLESAVPLFEYVRRRGIENEMDHACISTALRSMPDNTECRIAVNVHPVTLAGNRDFVGHLLWESNHAGIDPSRLIVEIGEQTPAGDDKVFHCALARLRERGVAIAVDDVGYGHANYKSIIDCSPDYLKIDRYFVHLSSEDPKRRAVIRSILELADFFGAEVVAEGVEREEDHQALREMNIHLFQGFLFGGPPSHPMPAWFRSVAAVEALY